MPTIVYCDFAAGNNSTGDGSAGNPYKTIDKASTGLTGGDEVRCAKSAAPSSLGGNLTFTDGSTSVATSVDMTGSLAAKDFVGLNTGSETWWEISSINSTTITLVVAYRGTGGTGAGYKLGVTDTGTAAAAGTQVQVISASGSAGSLIKISGGWNLTGTPAQDGQTWFWQSGSTKNGYGLYATSKNYINLDGARLGFLRYYYGVSLNGSCSSWEISGLSLLANNRYGLYASTNCNDLIISDCRFSCNGASYAGLYAITTCYNWIVSGGIFQGQGYGIYATSTCRNWTITECDCSYNATGLYLNSASDFNIIDLTTNGNSSYGVHLAGCAKIFLYDYAHDESTWSNAGKINDWTSNGQKIVSIQESESGGAARNRVYFYGGYTQDNTAEADGGSGKCLQFNPKSATYWIEQDFQVPVSASTARTVAIKMKDDADFNGSVYLELWYMGELITGPTEKTMTTSYASQEMVAGSGDISVDGVLTLKVKVYGTAGCVYADTLSYS